MRYPNQNAHMSLLESAESEGANFRSLLRNRVQLGITYSRFTLCSPLTGGTCYSIIRLASRKIHQVSSAS